MMKVIMTLPAGTGRAFWDPKQFVKTAPTFNVNMLKDDNTRITTAPSTVKLGPEMYNFLSKTVPGIAARENEDLTYEGKVLTKPHSVNDLYAYYGYGEIPYSSLMSGNLSTTKHNHQAINNILRNSRPFDGGVNIIGFGKEVKPRSDPAHTFLYSIKLGDAKPYGTNSKSKVLTNILNSSWDFNPLFAPQLKYTDERYDPKKDPLGRGPRITDQYIPMIDPLTGERKRNENGDLIFMPLPRVLQLPIYNMKHPLWEKDPEKAWQLLNESKDLLNWSSWGVAPSYADYSGNIATKQNGDARTYDYELNNLRLADKGGYFNDYPEIIANRHQNYLNAKIQRNIANVIQARKGEIEKMHQDLVDKNNVKLKHKQNAAFFRPDDTAATTKGKQHNYYKVLIHRAMQDPGIVNYVRSNFGNTIDTDELSKLEQKLKAFIKPLSDYARYNTQSDDNAKVMAIITDYIRQMDKQSRMKNIAAALSDKL